MEHGADYAAVTFAAKYFSWFFAGLGLLWALLTYVLANTTFIHTETYAVIAAVFLFVCARLVIMQLRAGVEQVAPREETIALAGVALALIAAVLCCLLAPEMVRVDGVPGKTTPIAGRDLRVTFPTTGVALNEPASMHVDVHVGESRVVTLGGRFPLVLNDVLLSLQAHTVATVEARGLAGEALTITQPVGNAFLSPILFFSNTTSIADLQLPSDVFALPAHGRTVRAFLVTADQMHDPRIARMSNDTAGVLFAVDDGNGRPLEHAIGFAPDGLPQTLGDVTLVPHLRLFPVLQVASVPQPLPMLIGTAAYVFGGLMLVYRRRMVG